jgi:hypothetical protein
MKIKLKYIVVIAALTFFRSLAAQDRTVENRPYTDLRPIHFGVMIGTHWQDMELLNAGPQTITKDDGTTYESVVSADQDRWDPGFTVGVLAEFRISTHFQFRLAPAMFFGTRHITFHNYTETDDKGQPIEQRQEMKTSYFSTSFDLIFSAPRFNNHRPYLVTGIVPMLNLTNNSDDYLRLKQYNAYAEIGVGCDFYLPFFKLRPELKFMYSLSDNLDSKHPSNLRDKNMLPYAMSVSSAHTKIIALTFYFE